MLMVSFKIPSQEQVCLAGACEFLAHVPGFLTLDICSLELSL